MAQESDALLYRAITYTVGDRESGRSRSIDGNLHADFAFPGADRPGTNPEQTLAAAWSACFVSTIELLATRRGLILPSGIAIDAEMDLSLGDDGFFLSAKLYVDLPQIDRMTACSLVEEAYRESPFSKAMRGNLSLSINLIVAGSLNFPTTRVVVHGSDFLPTRISLELLS
jgi:Ohr subfamily peroxiredoxin